MPNSFAVNANYVTGFRSPRRPARAVWDFHRALPIYRPTPVHALPGAAAALGVARVFAKDETNRFGLPAFKVLGGSWAVRQLLERTVGRPLADDMTSLPALGKVAAQQGYYLLTASAGNHGHAVARVAAWAELPCRVLLPAPARKRTVDLITAEGAAVDVISGSYGHAVNEATAIAAADDRALLLSDTSWPGYDEVPRDIVDGYSTMFRELSSDIADVDIVAVQIGVGSLADAAVSHFSHAPRPTQVLGVEPAAAAAVMASVTAGRLITVPGPHRTTMHGLSCDTPSIASLPDLRFGLQALTSVEDDFAVEARRLLAGDGVEVGPTGAAGLAGLLALCHDDDAGETRARLGLDRDSHVLVLLTEGSDAAGV